MDIAGLTPQAQTRDSNTPSLSGPRFQEKWPEALNLSKFLTTFVPGFLPLENLPDDIFVIPTPRNKKLKRYNTGCRQSLKSLLMDTIRDWYTERNVLTAGFGYSDNTGDTRLLQRSLNASVDYWLSARSASSLHAILGDDILRYLWSQYVFVLLDTGSNNALQIAGPQFTNKRTSNKRRRQQSHSRHRKKRKIDTVPKLLQPHACLYRKPLFYNNMYTKHVGIELPMTPHELYADIMDGGDASVSGLSVCEVILRNHRRIDYHRILHRHCSLPPDYSSFSIDKLATKGITDTASVIKFCVSVLEKLLPAEFWGHERNKSNFLQHQLPAILRLRRHERYPNKALMHGIRITHFKWLSSESNTRRHHGRLYQRVLVTLRWLVHSYIFVLLQRTFYITETQFRHQTMCYYRKPVWALFRSLSWKQLSQYQWLSSPPENTAHWESKLRLMPKETGVRPISLQKSTNKKMASTFAVLNHCSTDNGAGMQGLVEFYPKYRDFLSTVQPHDRLHFACVDIRHCFDNIQTNRLLELVREKLSQHSEFVLQKYLAVRKSAKLHTYVGLPEHFGSFTSIAQQVPSQGRILVDVSRQNVVQSDAVLEDIRLLLEQHMLLVNGRYNSRWLLQRRGIPQGNIVSSLLCNLYYADVERKLGLDFEGSLLVRMVDDFLLVSKQDGPIDTFLRTMEAGDSEIGVEINKEKTRVSNSSDDKFFPWCGLLFDSETGQVRIDFSRLPLDECLRVERGNHPGEGLEHQVLGFCRPRCLPILFDPAVNNLETRFINFYQVIAFAAVRTALYVKDLQGSNCSSVPNEGFVVKVVERSIAFAISTVASRMKAHQVTADVIGRRHARWLGQTAWIDVFSWVPMLRSIGVLIGSKRSEATGTKASKFLRHCSKRARLDMGLNEMLHRIRGGQHAPLREDKTRVLTHAHESPV